MLLLPECARLVLLVLVFGQGLACQAKGQSIHTKISIPAEGIYEKALVKGKVPLASTLKKKKKKTEKIKIHVYLGLNIIIRFKFTTNSNRCAMLIVRNRFTKKCWPL